MINCNHVCYSYGGNSNNLQNISFSLPKGSRTVLIGANGAGKTTLLKLLAGNVWARTGKISICETDPFMEATSQIKYLGSEWSSNPIVRQDISVHELIASIDNAALTSRIEYLSKLLEVDFSWRMNMVSDGERRRVQLLLGLARPYQVLLLDEVTAELDVVMRSNFLDFLLKESIEKSISIVYATHIFDGLATWPSHILHLHMGLIANFNKFENIQEYENIERRERHGNSFLLELVLTWIRKAMESTICETGLS